MSFTLEEMTERIRGAMNPDPGIGKTIKFDLKDDGIIHIDGSNVTNEDKPADLVMTIAKDDLIAMGEGKLDATMAFMSGKLKLSDMGLAMSLQPKMQQIFARLNG